MASEIFNSELSKINDIFFQARQVREKNSATKDKVKYSPDSLEEDVVQTRQEQ